MDVEAMATVLRLSEITFGGVVQTKLGDQAADTLAAQAKEIKRLNETVRRVQASARTLDATRAEIYDHYAKASQINTEAVTTLDSEREANAILTAEIERLREALGQIKDGRGKCGTCDTVAVGEGSGVTMCDCANPVWVPQCPIQLATQALEPRHG